MSKTRVQVFEFENKVTALEVFMKGEIILVGGEATDNISSIQMLRSNGDGSYQLDNNLLLYLSKDKLPLEVW